MVTFENRLEPFVADHAIVVYSDIACPWAHVAVHRLVEARRTLGLETELGIVHRAFPLEIINEQATPKLILDAEIPVCADLDPGAGWSTDPEPWTYPVSTLPALEAVQAAQSQGPELSVALDRALRRAMFEHWRCVAVFGVVLEVARTVDGLDVDVLWEDIESGSARTEVFHDARVVQATDIPGSPTLVLPDGTLVHNPGIDKHWEDGPGSRVVVDHHDPDIIVELVERARALGPAD